MNKILVIAKHELRQTLRRKSFILITIAFPLLAVLGYGIYQGSQHWIPLPSAPEAEKIGYVDETGEFNKYTSQDDVTFVLYSSEEEAKSAFLAGEIDEYFIIPGHYLTTGLVTRYTRERELGEPGETLSLMEGFLLSNLLDGKASGQVMERVKTPMALISLRLDESGEIATGQNFLVNYFVPYIFAVLFLLSIFFSSGFLLQSVSEEKENRVIEILLSSVSSRQLLIGKVLGLGAAGLLQMAIWLTTIRIFAGIASVNIPALSELSIPIGVLALGLVYFILGYLLFAALYAGIGSLGSTAREGQSLSGIIAMPTGMLPMMFSTLITTNPDHIISRVLTFFPLTAPITAMMRLSIQALPAWEIVLSIGALATSVVLAMIVSAKVLRTCLLMYGKRPSLRQIARYIREA